MENELEVEDMAYNDLDNRKVPQDLDDNFEIPTVELSAYINDDYKKQFLDKEAIFTVKAVKTGNFDRLSLVLVCPDQIERILSMSKKMQNQMVAKFGNKAGTWKNKKILLKGVTYSFTRNNEVRTGVTFELL